MRDPEAVRQVGSLSGGDLIRWLRLRLQERKRIPQPELNSLVLNWVRSRPAAEVCRFLPRLVDEVARGQSLQTAWNLLSFLEVALKLRRPRVGIYDHAFHSIGGAQKYGATIAQTLQHDFDVTLLSNRPVALADLESWYGLDLSLCRLKVIPLPFFERKGRAAEIIDPAEVDTRGENPFAAVARESGDYDVFVNNGMLEMVYPLANASLFICHFPEREKSLFFYVDRYTEIVYNSLYTARWIEKRWNLHPHRHIYPPVDMEPEAYPKNKENIILSVGRFDIGGNKQQFEIVQAFEELVSGHRQELEGWKLVLAGGSPPSNSYLEKIKAHLREKKTPAVELQVNIPAFALRAIYEKAKIFWHFCGLGQTDPAKIEHFGMAVAEAMQNGCVPVVFRGGGQAEIVEPGASGFLFSTKRELSEITLRLLRNPGELAEMSLRAYQSGKKFGGRVFAATVREYFDRLLATRFTA